MSREEEPRSGFIPVQPETSPTAKAAASRLIQVEYLSGEFPNPNNSEDLEDEWLLDESFDEFPPITPSDTSGDY